MKIGSLFVLFSAMAPMPVAAQSVGEEPETAAHDDVFAAGLTGGTLGVGPELSWRVSDHVGIRGNATFLGISASPQSDDLEYRADLKLASYGGMIDLYPFGSSFRVSGGARINNNRATLDAELGDEATIDIGDGVYTADEVGTLSGKADFKKFAPMFTIGLGGSNRRGFFFGADAGILLQGSVKVSEFTATGSLENDPQFRADLEQERRDLQEDLEKYKVYPVLMATIGVRF